MSEVSDHTGEIGDIPVFWRSAPTEPAQGSAPGDLAGPATPAPPLYLHGVPTSSDDWIPFLELGGGLAPDLPGFGRTGKPGHYDYSLPGYTRFIEEFLDLTETPRVSLVMHDWGGAGLSFAQRHPERVERIVLINAVPLLPGFRWHRLARVWRRPLLGELAMGFTVRPTLRWMSRSWSPAPGPAPDALIDQILAHLDHGTQRAILRLYRSAPEEVLAASGLELGELRMPALVLWSGRDPFLPPELGARYAEALGAAQLVTLPQAGHWPWLDQPELVERVVSFARGG